MANRIRVVIVDDIAETREHLAKLLSFEPDIQIAGSVSSGTEAITLAGEKDVDVVLLDINMPRMNGVEVLKDIKQIDESIAVIMVTANEQVQLAAEALKSGAFGYVPKPFDFRYLDHMLATIFDKPRNARK